MGNKIFHEWEIEKKILAIKNGDMDFASFAEHFIPFIVANTTRLRVFADSKSIELNEIISNGILVLRKCINNYRPEFNDFVSYYRSAIIKETYKLIHENNPVYIPHRELNNKVCMVDFDYVPVVDNEEDDEDETHKYHFSDEQAEKINRTAVIQHIIKKLTERQQFVINRYMLGLSDTSTAKTLGLSRERIRQIKEEILDKLRLRRNIEILREFL